MTTLTTYEKRRRVLLTPTNDSCCLHDSLFNISDNSLSEKVLECLSIHDRFMWANACRFNSKCQKLRFFQFIKATNAGITVLNHIHYKVNTLLNNDHSFQTLSRIESLPKLSTSSISFMNDHIRRTMSSIKTFTHLLNQRNLKELQPWSKGYDPERLSKLSIEDEFAIELHSSPTPSYIWIEIYNDDLCTTIITDNDRLVNSDVFHNVINITRDGPSRYQDDLWDKSDGYAIAFVKMLKSSCRKFSRCNNIVKVIEAWEQISDDYGEQGNEHIIIRLDDEGVHIRLDFDSDTWDDDWYNEFLHRILLMNDDNMIEMIQWLFPISIPSILFPRHRSLEPNTYLDAHEETNKISDLQEVTLTSTPPRPPPPFSLYTSYWIPRHPLPRLSKENLLSYHGILFGEDKLGVPACLLIVYLSIQECMTISQTSRYARQSFQSRIKQFLNTTNNGEIIINDYYDDTLRCSMLKSQSQSQSQSILASLSTISARQLKDDHVHHSITNLSIFKQLLRQRKWKKLSDDEDYQYVGLDKIGSDFLRIEVISCPDPTHIWISVCDKALRQQIYNENKRAGQDMKTNEDVISCNSLYARTFFDIFKIQCRNTSKYGLAVKVIETWQYLSNKLGYYDLDTLIRCRQCQDINGHVIDDDYLVEIRLDFSLEENLRSDAYFNFIFRLTQMDPKNMMKILFPTKTVSNVTFPKHRSIPCTSTTTTTTTTILAETKDTTIIKSDYNEAEFRQLLKFISTTLSSKSSPKLSKETAIRKLEKYLSMIQFSTISVTEGHHTMILSAIATNNVMILDLLINADIQPSAMHEHEYLLKSVKLGNVLIVKRLLDTLDKVCQVSGPSNSMILARTWLDSTVNAVNVLARLKMLNAN